MTENTCKSCQSFWPFPTIQATIDPQSPHGLCRRYPPQLMVFPAPSPHGVQMIERSDWPQVRREFFCGEYAPTKATIQ